MLTIVYENLLRLINIILVIAIVKPIAAQNCTSCTLPMTNPSLVGGGECCWTQQLPMARVQLLAAPQWHLCVPKARLCLYSIMEEAMQRELKVCRNECFIETCMNILNGARPHETTVINSITVEFRNCAQFNRIIQVSIKHWFQQTFDLHCTYRPLLQYDLMEHTFECGSSGGFGFVDYHYDIDNPYFVTDITNITSIQCYTESKLNSRNQGYLPTFSVHFTNLSTIADPIQRRQSEFVRSIAGSHKHLHRFWLRLYRDLSLLSISFIHSLRSARQRQCAKCDRTWQLRLSLLSVIANARFLFFLYKQ
jgi:hypothetical protein